MKQMNKQLTFLLSLTFLFLFGCGEEEVQKNVKRLKVTNSCENCTIVGANLNGAKLTGAKLNYVDLNKANLKEANLIGVYLTGATKCKTTMPWGEENSGC